MMGNPVPMRPVDAAGRVQVYSPGCQLARHRLEASLWRGPLLSEDHILCIKPWVLCCIFVHK